jgi:hypothetical protein
VATIVSILVSGVLWLLREPIASIVSMFGVVQEPKKSRILVASLFGTYSHVFMDSFIDESTLSNLRKSVPWTHSNWSHLSVLSILWNHRSPALFCEVLYYEERTRYGYCGSVLLSSCLFFVCGDHSTL